jgi:ribosome maturation factor RimP
VRDELRSDRDFASFKGFPVTVTTSEVFRKKTVFEGTLLDRDCEHVRVSTKGRITKIPRALVAGVALPKAKFEPTDLEIRGKLR